MAELKNLTIDEISLVAKGDNKGAKILMVKSKDEVSKELSPEDLSAMMEKLMAAMADLKEMAAMMKPTEDEVIDEKEMDEDPEKDEKALDVDVEEEDEDEDMEKSISVSKELIDIQKRLDEKEELIKELVEDKVVEKFEKAATKFTNLPIEKEALAKALREIDAMVAKDELLTMLTALDAQLEQSDLFKSVGASGESAGDDNKLDTLAKARAVESKLSFAQAYTQVLKENPELYNKGK